MAEAAVSGVIPVVTFEREDAAADVAHALRDGGIGHLEVTLRTAAGLAAIARAASVPGVVVGAGTVRRAADLDAAADAGAAFAVSPGFDEALVEHALAIGLPIVPGVATAGELMRSAALGVTAVKLFPITPLGGLGFVDALAGPFPDAVFMPSGGVGAADVAGYLAHPRVFAVGVGWLVQRSISGDDELRAITAAARRMGETA